MENNNTLKEVIIVKWSTGPIMRRFQLKKSEWSYSNMLDKIHLLQPGFNDILHYSGWILSFLLLIVCIVIVCVSNWYYSSTNLGLVEWSTHQVQGHNGWRTILSAERK